MHDKANLGSYCCLAGRGGDIPAPKGMLLGWQVTRAITLESKLPQADAMPRQTGTNHSSRPHRAAVSYETNRDVVGGVCIRRCCSFGVAACALGNPHERGPTGAALSSPLLLKAQLKHESQSSMLLRSAGRHCTLSKAPWTGL